MSSASEIVHIVTICELCRDMNPEVSYFANHAGNRLEMIEPFVHAFDHYENYSSGWSGRYGGSTADGVFLLWALKSVW
eukprot:SAG11_NODE_407_length_9712_cov_11.569437_4_plen_78_part_00